MKRNILLTLIIGIFLIGMVNAYEPHKQNTDLEFSFTSNNATSCNVTTANTPSGIVVINQESTRNGQTFNNTITEGNFSVLGNYCFNIVCSDGVENENGQVCKEISSSGDLVSETKIYANILIAAFFLLLILVFYFTTKNINYEKWHNSIIAKYEHRNYVKVLISSIGYNFMKNKFIWYYLFGLPFILIVTDIAYTFGVNSMIELLKILLMVYYFGFLLVGVFFFGYLQEWIMSIVDEIKSLDLGV